MNPLPPVDPSLLRPVRAAGLDAAVRTAGPDAAGSDDAGLDPGDLQGGDREIGDPENRGADAGLAATSSALAVEYRTDATGTVAEFGRLLARLHALPVPEGSTVLDARSIAAARRTAFEYGELADLTVGAAYRHIAVERLVELLDEGAEAAASRAGAPVLTHGRPTLAVFRWERWNPIGLDSWEHLAVADRNRDLAAAARSIVTELEPAFLPPFFDAYGHDHLDLLQLDWYSLALELDPGLV